jgi:hypothetical protein
LEQLGAEADKQGGAGTVVATAKGATLSAVMQDLEAEATPDGLWLTSAGDEDAGRPNRFRLRAVELRHDDPRDAESPRLAASGEVTLTDSRVMWVRPGLIEEYSVSTDGVRQDFVITKRPAGEGNELEVKLEISGAHAEQADHGVRLFVAASGRELAYHRLRVTDAGGRELAARMEVTGPDRLRIVVGDEGAEYPVRIDPTFSDANWLSVGGLLGASHSLLSMAVDGVGNLYVGGSFTEIGGVAANRTAKWDGNDWSSLGSGTDGQVRTLVFHNGDLYAGGFFQVAGGVPVNCVARWNGTAWSAVGSGLNGDVLALVSHGGNLYAGGAFDKAGGVTVNSIAMWDGTAWSGLGGGMSGGGFPIVYALAFFGGDLYAGGNFTSAGSVSASRIARWSGSEWSALSGGVDGLVRALSPGATNLYVGGDFTLANGISANRVAQWNGTAWSALGSGVNNGVNNSVNVLFSQPGGNLYAGGSFTTAGGVTVNRVASWDGGTWNAFNLGVSGAVRTLAVSGTKLYVGGDFTSAGAVLANAVAQWDGAVWSPLSRALNNQVTALVLHAGELIAGGAFTRAGGLPAGGLARWDGDAWTPLGTGVNGTVEALASDGVNVYVGGEFSTVGGVPANRVARWDGTSWTALGTGANATVTALAVSGGTLYAGGNFGSVDGVPANHIAKWDGSGWAALGSGLAGGFGGITRVHALAVNGGGLVVGGLFDTAGGVAASNVARWNGTLWSGLGSGVNNEVFALLMSGSDLYVGGMFSMAGGVNASRIARWDGAGWSPLGAGLGGSGGAAVFSLAAMGGTLYAGGSFTTAGGAGANYIARWGGGGWSPLASGMNNGVQALVLNGTMLHAGGSFTTAGGKSRPFIARADIGSGEPEIRIGGNGGDIADGDITPDAADGTHFGSMSVTGDYIERTFTITNEGTADLLLTAGAPDYVTLSGSTAFSVVAQPADGFVPLDGGSLAFTIRYDPATTGAHNAVVTITSNDADEAVFTFAISGLAQDQVTTTFSNPAVVSLPAGAPGTSSGPASPYPSMISVSGITGDIAKVVVKLHGLTHTYPSDLDILLVGPTGITCPLMSDVGGGNSISGVELVFDSTAATSLSGSGIIGGTYQPSNIGINDAFDAPAPPSPYGASLTAFDTLAKVNGTWSLYIMDDESGDSGSLAGGWEICVISVPSSAPEIAVSGNGVDIVAGDATPAEGDHTDFGIVAHNGGTMTRTFTISNFGTDALSLTGTPRVAVGGTHASEFVVTLDPDASVAGGGSTTFRVTFDPGGSGLRTATLSLVNDDTDENPFTFSIQGIGQAAQEIFDAAMLSAGLSGMNAGAGAAPFSDGTANLLKQAFNMNLTGPDVRVQTPGGPPGGLPAIDFEPAGGGGPVFRFEFVRRVRSGLIYTPLKNLSLNPLTWTPLTATPVVSPIDDEWERVIYEESVDLMTAQRYFGRVQVTLP